MAIPRWCTPWPASMLSTARATYDAPLAGQLAGRANLADQGAGSRGGQAGELGVVGGGAGHRGLAAVHAEAGAGGQLGEEELRVVGDRREGRRADDDRVKLFAVEHLHHVIVRAAAGAVLLRSLLRKLHDDVAGCHDLHVIALLCAGKVAVGDPAGPDKSKSNSHLVHLPLHVCAIR